MKVEAHHLCGVSALYAANHTPLQQQPDERDTAFVKRIVCAYHNAYRHLASRGWHMASPAVPEDH